MHSLQSVPRQVRFLYDCAMTWSKNFSIRDGWPTASVAWLAIGVFDGLQTVVSMHAMGMEHAWVTLFCVTVVSWAPWAMLTPVALYFLRHHPIPTRAVLPWLVHGAACLAIWALWAAWTSLLEHVTNPYAYPQADPLLPLLKSKLLGNLPGTVMVYGAVIVLSITFETRSRLLFQQAASARLSESLAQSQLAALRLQLEPHFIFNALNAITALIREQRNGEAVDMTAALGDLLRRVTDQTTGQFVTLGEEIDFLGKYLGIQQMRFGARLRCRIDIPDALMTAQVPEFILQPLVENAIQHGIAQRGKGGALRVAAASDGAVLTLQVFNEGPLLADPVPAGVGLSNTRQRLHALYGHAQALTLQNDGTAGVLATVALPYRIAR
ncbi:sensor histidine kinase [Pseudoduganella buxea]|uniref:sensor histidine kinase n=1 Tax=Pseudoduganella buxea TaxID=1949069 RepID=UPI001478E1ED|nr:histidine kinase [Pseudoduganella buxea]